MYSLLLGLFLLQTAVQNPRAEDELVSAATSLLQADQTERAVNLLEPFLKTNPKARRAAVLLAFGYVRQGKNEQARVLASRLVVELPRDYYTQHVLGLSLSGLNRQAEAETHFRRAIELKPDFGESIFQLGLLYMGRAAFAEARKTFERMIELGYRPADAHRNLGSIHSKEGRYAEAIEELNAALKLDPFSASAYFLLADAFRKSGDGKQAAEATRRFQELNTAEADKRGGFAKGQAFYQEGMQLMFTEDRDFVPANFAKARQAFSQAVESFPQLDGAYYRIAQIDYLRNDYSNALPNIQRALALNPNEAEYYFVLASCLKDRDGAAAISAATKAVTINPNVADFHNLRGILLERAGDDIHAIESFRRATQLAPQEEAFRLNLESALRKLSKKSPENQRSNR